MSKKILKIKKLRKNQEKELFVKLTKFIQNKISYYIENNIWTAAEIACQIGSHSSRISEIKSGSRIVSRSIFRNLLKEAFFDNKDILNEVSLNVNEIEYIKALHGPEQMKIKQIEAFESERKIKS